MKVCIVVPCYNEEERLNVDEFVNYSIQNSIDFLFVNDGSSDKTQEVLENMSSKSERISVYSMPNNSGKAEAVRTGMLKAAKTDKYDFIGFLDSDLATPLYEIDNFISCLEKHPHFKMIMGIRIKRLGSLVNRNLPRHYLGRAFATSVSITLNLPTYDTQCGAKLIGANLVKETFEEPFVSSWFFDVEIIYRIKKLKGEAFALNNIYEHPIFEWKEVGGSKIKFKHYLVAPFELLKIKLKYS